MVKRYQPEASMECERYGDMESYAVCEMKRKDDGDYVTYEAYRILEKELNILKYGDRCVQLAKRFDLTPKKLQSELFFYCRDHFYNLDCYPVDMAFDENEHQVIPLKDFFKVLSQKQIAEIEAKNEPSQWRFD